jgi:hypothetical protein
MYRNRRPTGELLADCYIEPTMEVKAEEGSWHTKSLPVQRENPSGNRGEEEGKSGTGRIITGSCQSEKKRDER